MLKATNKTTLPTAPVKELNFELTGNMNRYVWTMNNKTVSEVEAIPVSQLPSNALYVAKHYNGAKITETGKVTDASGKHMFEAEIKGKDLIFDEKGIYIKTD